MGSVLHNGKAVLQPGRFQLLQYGPGLYRAEVVHQKNGGDFPVQLGEKVVHVNLQRRRQPVKAQRVAGKGGDDGIADVLRQKDRSGAQAPRGKAQRTAAAVEVQRVLAGQAGFYAVFFFRKRIEIQVEFAA